MAEGSDIKTEYLVQWKGYTKSESTWEPESHLTDYGAVAAMNAYRHKPGLNVYSTTVATDMSVYRAVLQLMARHKLEGTIQ